jgi:hypothetical protein
VLKPFFSNAAPKANCCCCCCHRPRRSVLHIHTIVEECEVTKLIHAVDMKTKEPKKVSSVTTWLLFNADDLLAACW